MSTERNTRWLEMSRENFEEATLEGNWDTARAIIQDVKGFSKSSAAVLEAELIRIQNEEVDI